MEMLRGTDHGARCSRPGCREGPGTLRAHFGERWRTAVIATGGERPATLPCGACPMSAAADVQTAEVLLGS